MNSAGKSLSHRLGRNRVNEKATKILIINILMALNLYANINS